MITFQEPVNVGKVERYSIDVSSFTTGQALISATVASSSGLITVGSTVIDGDIISALITGVNVGRAVVEFNYATATRTECSKVQLLVSEC